LTLEYIFRQKPTWFLGAFSVFAYLLFNIQYTSKVKLSKELSIWNDI
jgi:hypothetical protein